MSRFRYLFIKANSIEIDYYPCSISNNQLCLLIEGRISGAIVILKIFTPNCDVTNLLMLQIYLYRLFGTNKLISC